MATWNADKPAVGNQISADIPDIEENFQELHDVTEAITNGTLGTTTASAFKVNAITSPAMWIERAKFQYKDADEIYINPGAYHHNGTVAQVVYWSSQLTSDIGSPDASDWYYLYLDDSAIVTAGTNLLTATEFVWSNTEPTYTVAKHGWYNGEDRCIFAVLTDGSSNILEFFHDGGDLVFFADDTISDQNGAVTATFTDNDVTLTAPKFSTKIHISYGLTAVNETSVRWRTNGQTASTGHYFAKAITEGSNYGTLDVISDSSQVIEVKCGGPGTETLTIYTAGWYFPAGV